MAEDEPLLPVEKVAQHLGLPPAILIRRIEAGDLPARESNGPNGPRYELRLSDLGIYPRHVPGLVPPPQPVRPADAFAANTGARPAPRSQTDMRAGRQPQPAPVSTPTPRPTAASAPMGAAQRAPAGPHVAAPSVHGPVAQIVDAVVATDRSATSPQGRALVLRLLESWQHSLCELVRREERERIAAENAKRDELIGQLRAELEAVRAEHSKTLESFRSEHERIIDAWRAEHLQQVDALRADHEKALETLRAEHAAALAAKDRTLTERERALADRQREVTLLRTTASPRRRGFFSSR